MVEKKIGAEMDCLQCGTHLTCNEKHYKASGNFPEKTVLQWQNQDGTAHYSTNDGKNFTCNISETISTATTSGETTQIKIKTDYFDEQAKSKIKDSSVLLWHIKQQVESSIKECEATPNGGMIWEMTKIIYQRQFGDEEV